MKFITPQKISTNNFKKVTTPKYNTSGDTLRNQKPYSPLKATHLQTHTLGFPLPPKIDDKHTRGFYEHPGKKFK